MYASMSDIMSFVCTMLLDGGCDRSPITEEDASYTMKEWDKEGVEYPESMEAVDLAYAWNTAVGNNPDGKPSDLEVRANVSCVPYHRAVEDLECAFLSDHVLPYRDHVIVVFYRYNHKTHDSSWCCAVYSFDTDDHSCEGMCTLRQLLMKCFDDPGCAVKVGLQIADNKRY